jgi:hypothetical protein
MDLLVEVNDEESEINISEIGLRFFEGSTKISGKINDTMVSGKGFAELLHSYEDPVIILKQPEEMDLWNDEKPLIWYVDNPDDGNPLKYDIEIEYETDVPFRVSGGMVDTMFFWNPSVFSTDTSFFIRIRAYSSDTTLQKLTKGQYLIVHEDTDLNACMGENIQIDLNLDNNDFNFKWFFNDQVTTFPETSVLNISPVTNGSEGAYKCLVYNEFFQDTTLVYHLSAGSCNSIGEYHMQDFLIYPNPFFEKLTIRLSVKADKYLLRVKNLLGDIVYESISSGLTDEVILSHVKPGMYIIEIISQDSHEIRSSRIIKCNL